MTREEVKALIAEKIKTNGEGAITAEVLADVLNAVVDVAPQSNRILKVNHEDVIDYAHDLSQTLYDGNAFGIFINGEGGARMLPVSCMGTGWMYEYQEQWRISDEDITMFDGRTWGEFLEACDKTSNPIITPLQIWGDEISEDGNVKHISDSRARNIKRAFALNLDGSMWPRCTMFPEICEVVRGGLTLSFGEQFEIERMFGDVRPVDSELQYSLFCLLYTGGYYYLHLIEY